MPTQTIDTFETINLESFVTVEGGDGLCLIWKVIF